MSRPLIPQGGDDRVYTPDELAYAIVKHFEPGGSVLEPCEGGGAFTRAFRMYNQRSDSFLRPVCAFDIDGDTSVDFLNMQSCGAAGIPTQFDWLITNPPWSLFRQFLKRSMQVADNVVFLVTLNHFFTKARMRDVEEAGFGYREALLVDTPPKPWPSSGFQVGAVHLVRGWEGPMKFSRL